MIAHTSHEPYLAGVSRPEDDLSILGPIAVVALVIAIVWTVTRRLG